MRTYSEGEEQLIEVFSIFSGAVGFLGALVIIVSFLVFPKLRSFAFRLILYLSLSDAGAAVFMIMGPAHSSTAFCEIQGFFTSFFNLLSVLWTDLIA